MVLGTLFRIVTGHGNTLLIKKDLFDTIILEREDMWRLKML